MSEEIVNKVSRSSLQTIDLEKFYTPGERHLVDISNHLFQGLILKEADFRDYIKSNDWSRLKDKHVAITCTADAIVPTWAYMLLSTTLRPFARTVVFGSLHDLEVHLYRVALGGTDWSKYLNSKVVIKGCSNLEVPVEAFVDLTNLLLPIASSIMFGEPCSTVPIYKKRPSGSLS